MHVSPEQQLIEVQDSLSEAHVLVRQIPLSHLLPKQQSVVVLHAVLTSAHVCVSQMPV
jgi:hypothetical protein